MAKASREFQVFAKPIGSLCNLDCHYCYYLEKEHLYPEGARAIIVPCAYVLILNWELSMLIYVDSRAGEG
jgi:sulfatase maturation enzyme AslB (radical SAM superfamily)